MERKDTLDAVAKADLAHGKAGLRPPAARNHHALECLQAFLVALLDLHVHADAVTRREFRNISTLGLSQQFLDDQVSHDCPPVTEILEFVPACSSAMRASNCLSSSPSAAPSNRSGRLRTVFSKAVCRRQRRISSWLPETRTSGTCNPRKSAGRV